jgi:hypothetical protein
MMKGIFIAGVLSVLPVAAFAQVQQSSQSNGQSTSTAVVETGGGDGGSGGGYEGAHGNNVDSVAPTIYSNNSCAMSYAGSASFLGVGFGAGFNKVDRHCDDRASEIIMLTAAQKFQNPALMQWAVNMMCKDNPDTAPAGMCGGSSPVAVVASAAVRAVVPVQSPTKPDWCYTASRAEVAEHPECK